MNRYLLLILLSSWAHVVPLSFQCETGVAYPNHTLSIPRSLMANADVAVLKTYHTETLDKCITDCCAEKFGHCSVASFKKAVSGNSTEGNCQHFNCRPVTKCKYLSSNSTDTFSFSSTSSSHVLVPSSSHASKNDSSSPTAETTVTTDAPKTHTSSQNKQEYAVTEEAAATYYEEQLAFKNDNTSIKPRKGVTEDMTESPFKNSNRSGVKPRKGVSFDDVAVFNYTRSKVKPRKGVSPYDSVTSSAATVKPSISHSLSSVKYEPYSTLTTTGKHAYKDIVADDVISALEKVFEDDTAAKEEIGPSTTSSSEAAVVQSTLFTSPVVHSTIPAIDSSAYTSGKIAPSSVLQSSFSTSYAVSTSVHTPHLSKASATVNRFMMPSSSSPSILEHSKLLFHEVKVYDNGKSAKKEEEEIGDSAESENERKYKSSMHLVLSLVFGLLVLFSVLGVVAKRVYDGWMRRHYRRMDFLIDGMYDGYG